MKRASFLARITTDTLGGMLRVLSPQRRGTRSGLDSTRWAAVLADCSVGLGDSCIGGANGCSGLRLNVVLRGSYTKWRSLAQLHSRSSHRGAGLTQSEPSIARWS